MSRVPDEGSRMPPVRGEDEEERQDERGQDAVEVHVLRLERGAQDRRLGQAARPLPVMAARQEAAGRHAGRRAGLQAEDGPLPATSNSIEGGVNAQLGAMLGDHRGLSIERRAKAIFWWCYMHSPDPLPAAEILRAMPTGRSIAEVYGHMGERERLEGTIPRWGDAIVWSELHSSEPYRMDWD